MTWRQSIQAAEDLQPPHIKMAQLRLISRQSRAVLFCAAFLGVALAWIPVAYGRTVLHTHVSRTAPLASQAISWEQTPADAMRGYWEEHGVSLSEDGTLMQDDEGIFSRSAQGAAVPLSRFEFSKAPSWPDATPIETGFAAIRDQRFFVLPEMKNFPRRLSWMYPDDGCYARAHWSRKLLKDRGYPEPKKLFIFGSLAVQTENAPGSWVTWWYHVVPAYQVRGNLMVFDPSIDAKKPLPLKEWISTMTENPGSVRLSLCDSSSYEPASACNSPDPNANRRAQEDQSYFLRAEWDRLQELGRDPENELGEHPPWSAAEAALETGLT